MSLLVKIGKKGKRIIKKIITPAEKRYVSYTRRIERVKTDKKICAMTFDDGPMDVPASPDRFGGRSMTDVLLDTLAKYDAKGTFDVIGCTAENYPDEAGKLGSAEWGGIKYDHYPDINIDERGGALNSDRLIRRMLDEGHEITNHGYRHIIFGKKPFVYGKRAFLGSLDAAVEDLRKLDGLMKERYGYGIKLSRPPHYVDKIGDGFTSYDVYDRMGYQYMAASFDGAGWLPSVLPDPEQALKAECDAMINPIKNALEADPDVFCGQIIFQKDGYNMAKRTPVAFALEEQLKILKEYGYKVVTVSELMNESQFEDVGRDDPLYEKLAGLSAGAGVAFSDNKLRLDAPMLCGELAMLIAPKEEAMKIREDIIRKNGKAHPYAGAMEYCRKNNLIKASATAEQPVTELPESLFNKTGDYSRRGVFSAYKI